MIAVLFILGTIVAVHFIMLVKTGGGLWDEGDAWFG